VPKREVVRLHASSGTTGKSTVVGYTRKDLELWSDMVARFLLMAGVTQDSVLKWRSGMACLPAASACITAPSAWAPWSFPPPAATHAARPVDQRFRTTHIVCTPSYAMHICEVAAEMGVDLMKQTAFRTACLGGEPWSEQMRQRMFNLYGISGYDNYA